MRGWNGRTIVAATVVAFVAAVVWLAAGSARVSGPPAARAGATAAGELPGRMAGLPLVDRVTGPAALHALNDLHGTDIKLTGGEIATYGAGDRVLVVWVGEVAGAQRALELVDRMTEKISRGGTPFTVPGARSAGGRTYYVTSGTGMENAYFARDSRVYWLGAANKAPDSQRILEEGYRSLAGGG